MFTHQDEEDFATSIMCELIPVWYSWGS